MAKVKVRIDQATGEKESLESLIRRFKKLVLKENLMLELRKHEYYKSKSVKRREKSETARRLAESKKSKRR